LGGRIAHAAVSRRPPIPLSRMVARTKGYTYAATVWALSMVQGRFLSARAKPLQPGFSPTWCCASLALGNKDEDWELLLLTAAHWVRLRGVPPRRRGKIAVGRERERERDRDRDRDRESSLYTRQRTTGAERHHRQRDGADGVAGAASAVATGPQRQTLGR
jgi:hypothetical protein